MNKLKAQSGGEKWMLNQSAKRKSLTWLSGLIALVVGFEFILAISPAEAKRRALIVGNDNYKHVTPLKKAVNDANAIATTLQDLGFQIDIHNNLDRRTMNSAIANFTGTIEKDDEVVFFFSGHGIAVRGENYLLPIDVPAVNPGQEGFIRREAFQEDEIIHALKSAGARVSILILDACRNNPFPKKGTRSLGRKVGLGRTVAPPEGTFVMYSAGVGQEALDRLSDDDPHPNSVYTRKLIPLLKVKGMQIVRVAKRLRSEVEALAKTARAGPHRQYPSYYDELRGDFFFTPGELKRERSTTDADETFWRTIEASNNAGDFEFYLKEFPKGRFSAIAKLRLHQLNRKEQKSEEEHNGEDKKKEQQKTKASNNDDLYWSIVQHSSRLSDYADYLLKFPEGAHRGKAMNKIETLKKLAMVNPPGKIETPKTKTYKTGEIFIDCDHCPEMVVVPAGEFIMGELAKPGDRFRITEPKHKVKIARPFAIGKFEITRQEYDRFVKATAHDVGNLCWTAEPSGSKYRKNRSYKVIGMPRVDTYPTVCVNWLDAKAYVKWLNKVIEKQGVKGRYRLPTEAEWEYVARTGYSTKYDGNIKLNRLCDYANFAARETPYKWRVKACTDRHKQLAPVGTFKANRWGIHDLRGNVAEWTEDCAHYNYKGAPADGSAWLGGRQGNCAQRILRGGGWTNAPESLTSGARHYTKTTDRTVTYGFRVVKDLE